MDAQEHKDYQREKERLQFTVDYMKQVIQAAEAKRLDFKGNMKEAMVDLDHLDSSLSYVNILTNANMMDTTEKDLRNLKTVENKPYFSRLDFTPQGNDEPERLYIGKTSLFKKDTNEPVIDESHRGLFSSTRLMLPETSSQQA
jgi:DNA helicase II / ATP-dependent DNA helicase PcrA